MNAGDQESVISRKISSFLEDAFESVALTRRQYFSENAGKRPSAAEINGLSSSYANQNAIIAGAANLVPGPFGALAVVPEITLVIRNQIQMIYDIGVAHGKEAQLDSNLLLAIFGSIAGGGAISLLTVQGGKILVKRASLRVIQKIIIALGGKITQRALRSIIAKWLPVVGAAGMAYWARHTTNEIGKKASEILAHKEIIIDIEETKEINESEVL